MTCYLDFSVTRVFFLIELSLYYAKISKAKSFRVPENLTVRVRLKSITPSEPSPIRWRHGGEGQGREVVRGVFPKPGVSADAPVESHTLPVGQ